MSRPVLRRNADNLHRSDTPGFTPVPVDRAFRDGFGWVFARDQTVIPFDCRYEMGYPTTLESTGVAPQQGRRYVFACELPNGRYVCSAYMGGIWHMLISNLNHIIAADGRRVINHERSPGKPSTTRR